MKNYFKMKDAPWDFAAFKIDTWCLLKISTFFFKLQHIVFWDIEGNTETSVTEKTRRNWKGNWSRTRTRKKLLTVSMVISNCFCIYNFLYEIDVQLQQKNVLLSLGKLSLVEQKKWKHLIKTQKKLFMHCARSQIKLDF